MVYLTGDTHGPTSLGLHSVDGFSKRFNRENFPEQKEMGRDDFVIICGDFGGVWNYDSRYDESKSAFKEVVCLEHGESKEERYWLNWRFPHRPTTFPPSSSILSRIRAPSLS